MTDDEDGGKIERFDPSARRGRADSTDRRPVRRSDRDGINSPGKGNRPASSEETVTEAVAEAVTDSPVAAASESIDARLVAISQLDIRSFVYDHQLDGYDEPRRHPVALFDLHNTGNRPLRWQSARTKLIGTDGYTYKPAQLNLDPASLGPGCHTRQVEVEPGRRARVVTLVERLPAGVAVDEVVQTVPSAGGGTERLVFALE